MDGCFTKRQALAQIAETYDEKQKKFFVGGHGSEKDWSNFKKMGERKREEVAEAPELTVFVVRELSEAETEVVGKKTRELFGKNFYLDFRVDPSLLGGAGLAFMGKYRDYSVKARLEERKKEIGGIFYDQLKLLK